MRRHRRVRVGIAFVRARARLLARRLLCLGFLIGAIVTHGREARACGIILRVVDSSFPQDGATDVPTNVALLLADPDIATRPIVVRQASGSPEPFTTRTADLGVEIVPDQALAPNASYVVEVGGAQAFAFTTGTGPGPIIENVPPPRSVSANSPTTSAPAAA